MVVVLIAGIQVFILMHGRQVVAQQLNSVFNRQVSIGQVYVHPPLGLTITNLQVQDLLYVKKVLVSLGLFHIFDPQKDLSFSYVEVKEPVLYLYAGAQESKKEQPSERKTPKDSPPKDPAPKDPPLKNTFPAERSSSAVVIDEMIVRNGKINYIDSLDQSGNFTVTVEKLSLKARHVSFPKQEKPTDFRIKGSFVSGGGNKNGSGGEIEGGGWIDFTKKDMDGTFKIIDLDGRIFSPYYQKSLNRALKSLVINLEAHATSKNNDMQVVCAFKAKDIVFEKKEPQEGTLSIEDLIMEGIQSAGKEFAVNFKFKTRMDHFKVEYMPFFGNINGN